MDDQPLDLGQPDDPSEPRPDDARWEALARHLSGETTSGDDALVREWIESHPTDAAAIAALDRTLDGLAFMAPSDLDVERALRRVKAQRDADVAPTPAAGDPAVLPFRRPTPRPAVRSLHTRSTNSRWVTPLRAAAAIVVVAGGAVLWRATHARGGTDATEQTFATRVGQRDSVRLADGTRVVLGPGSRLEVPKDFTTGARRTVVLRGEAFFEVTHDAARPFVVAMRDAGVQDVGTAFVVRDRGAAGVAVSVRDGAVVLRPSSESAASGAADSVLLRAGDRGLVVDGKVVAQPGGAAASDDLAWTRGELVFHDATVHEVAAELRRWYGLELRLADSALGTRHFTATFHGEPADEVLRVLGLALGATAERHGDTVTVHASAGGTAAPPSR